jgi:hypothetical protein
MIGTFSSDISIRLRAMASDWPRSSASMPGQAPAVSMKETFGHLHQPQRLAVTLGLGHAEVAADLGLGIAALFVADQHHAAAADAGQTADDGAVVGEGAVAGQFLELVAHHPQVIEGVGPRRMAGQLRDLPGGEVAEGLRCAQPHLVFQGVDLGVDVDRGSGAGLAQLADLGFEVGDGLFEIEVIGVHATRAIRGRKGSQSSRHRCRTAVRQGMQGAVRRSDRACCHSGWM